MKKVFLGSAFIIALSACSQTNSPGTIESKMNGKAESTETLCFVKYSGLKNQDTAFVKLIVEGDEVSGDYLNIPFEKDARKGTITGVKSNGVIKGTWNYQQEGINDSIPFEFKLRDNKLLQKQTSYDISTGREFLPDTADFSIEFSIINCQKAR